MGILPLIATSGTPSSILLKESRVEVRHSLHAIRGKSGTYVRMLLSFLCILLTSTTAEIRLLGSGISRTAGSATRRIDRNRIDRKRINRLEGVWCVSTRLQACLLSGIVTNPDWLGTVTAEWSVPHRAKRLLYKLRWYWKSGRQTVDRANCLIMGLFSKRLLHTLHGAHGAHHIGHIHHAICHSAHTIHPHSWHVHHIISHTSSSTTTHIVEAAAHSIHHAATVEAVAHVAVGETCHASLEASSAIHATHCGIGEVAVVATSADIIHATATGVVTGCTIAAKVITSKVARASAALTIVVWACRSISGSALISSCGNIFR